MSERTGESQDTTSLQDEPLLFSDFTLELARSESMRPIDKQMLLDAEVGKVDAMARLLRHGADVDAAGITGWTPLMYAASYNYPGGARLLLAHGADLDRKNRDGHTAYDIALERKNSEITELLLAELGRRSTVISRPLKLQKPLRFRK
jgi:hypothetical protein